MAGPESQKNALQVIFSIFLGLMLTTFVGIGVYTFYPMPEPSDNPALQEQIRKLELERDSYYSKSQGELSPTDQARVAQLDTEIQKLYQEQNKPNETWGRNTSIILIAFATVVMAVSLIRADQLKVISNGLLLGGIFTMVYGTGWAIATGTSLARFWVVTAGLVITIVLGYIRFVRIKREEAEALTPSAAGTVEVGELATRISALERKVAGVGEALGSGD